MLKEFHDLPGVLSGPRQFSNPLEEVREGEAAVGGGPDTVSLSYAVEGATVRLTKVGFGRFGFLPAYETAQGVHTLGRECLGSLPGGK